MVPRITCLFVACWVIAQCYGGKTYLSSFQAKVTFPYSLKTSENQGFSWGIEMLHWCEIG